MLLPHGIGLRYDLTFHPDEYYFYSFRQLKIFVTIQHAS
jgi:hypothetical protein